MKLLLSALLLLSTFFISADTFSADTFSADTFSADALSADALSADALDGESLTKKYCSECHQQDGNSKDDNIPKIAGFSAALIYDILDQFRSEYRSAKEIKTNDGKTTNMVKISKRLSEEEVEALSSYFAKQTFKTEPQEHQKELIETGKQLHLDLCNSCHIDLGTGTDDDAPILAGQWKAYLIEQFEHFSSHKRHMTRRMKKKFRKLNNDDKKALIEFYASSTSQTIKKPD
jgi:sulfide dehydrogenase cytochrome subunit